MVDFFSPPWTFSSSLASLYDQPCRETRSTATFLSVMSRSDGFWPRAAALAPCSATGGVTGAGTSAAAVVLGRPVARAL